MIKNAQAEADKTKKKKKTDKSFEISETSMRIHIRI